MSKTKILKSTLACVTLVLTTVLGTEAKADATIIVNNNDSPGEGFNDPTPFTPQGGNPATTVGEARLNAFEFAASLWADTLNSGVPIEIDAAMNDLFCSGDMASLGYAGPITVNRDFAGAPEASTWYPIALANAIAGVDQDPDRADIEAIFNSDIDDGDCLGNTSWYYGLDANPPAGDIDFVTVVLHELGHGLGFTTFVDLASGAKLSGFDDVFMLYLEHHGVTPALYPDMTDAQRLTASTSDPNLHWIGTRTLNLAAGIPLTSGFPGGHVQMHAPSMQVAGSSVSHFSTALTPSELMEPGYAGPNHFIGTTRSLMRDIGWPETEITEVIDLTGDGMGNGLIRPGCLAVDGAGNVYVAGQGSTNAFKISPNGLVDEIIDETGDGLGNTLGVTHGIAVDGAGNAYVTGSSFGLFDNAAFKITPSGAVTVIIVGPDGFGGGLPLEYPNGIAVDGAGNVYVAGRDSNNVFKIPPGVGGVTEIIDGSGDNAGNQLAFCTGVAVDGAGNVYVAGQLTDNVFKITPGGVITEIIDSAAGLAGPADVAVDGAGNVYVTGNFTDNAFKITPGGAITEIIDQTGDGVTGLSEPEDIAVDAAGNVYVAGGSGNNAFKITPSGVISQLIGDTGGFAEGIAVAGAGTVYVSGRDSDTVFKIVPAPAAPGGVAVEFLAAAGDGSGNTLDNPVGIAVDGAGNAYVAGAVSDNAFRITPDGEVSKIIDASGDGINGFDGPLGIAVDGAGNVYVAGSVSDNAFEIAPDGGIRKIIDATGDGSNPLDDPRDIAVDAASNVYVTGNFSANAFKITSTEITEIIDATGDGAGNFLSNAFGIAVDGAGNAYVTGPASDNVFRITASGVVTQIIDATGDGGGNGLDGPTAVAVDSAGNVYVTGVNSDNAFKITPVGGITEIIDATGDGTNSLDFPNAISVDGAGNVFVVGLISDNVFQITPGGVITEIIDEMGTGTGNPLDNGQGVAVDGAQNVYVTGSLSDNALKIFALVVPVTYCTAKASSMGCVAAIGTSDPGKQPISGFSNYFVTASQVHQQKTGLLFTGTAGPANIPFNAGTLCAIPPLKRGPVMYSGGTNPDGCNGSYSTLVNDGSIIPSGLDAGMGNTAWYQYWYRDPDNGPGQLGTALSNAIEITFN